MAKTSPTHSPHAVSSTLSLCGNYQSPGTQFSSEPTCGRCRKILDARARTPEPVADKPVTIPLRKMKGSPIPYRSFSIRRDRR